MGLVADDDELNQISLNSSFEVVAKETPLDQDELFEGPGASPPKLKGMASKQHA